MKSRYICVSDITCDTPSKEAFVSMSVTDLFNAIIPVLKCLDIPALCSIKLMLYQMNSLKNNCKQLYIEPIPLLKKFMLKNRKDDFKNSDWNFKCEKCKVIYFQKRFKSLFDNVLFIEICNSKMTFKINFESVIIEEIFTETTTTV